MRVKSLLVTVAAASVLAAPSAYAEQANASADASAQDSQNVIVVVGSGLPETPSSPAYGTVLVDRDQITSGSSGRIEDVLNTVAGFQQFRRADSRSANPSAQGATVRALGGNASTRALLLLDGVPLSDPFFGYIPFSSIVPERLGSIRVTRGGGTGPFGAGALTGVIEMETADPRDLGLFYGQAMVNQRGETELSASLAPELGDGYAIVGGRWDRGQGFYTTPEDQRVDASARARFDSWSLNGRVVQPLTDDVEIQVGAVVFEDHRTLRFKGADSSSEGQDVSARIISRGPWQVEALAYGQWRNFTNIVVSSSNFTKTLDQRDTPSSGIGGKLEVRPPVGGGFVPRLGVDYRKSEGDLHEIRYQPSGAENGMRYAGGENTDLGFYAENDWLLGPLTLTGGVRADRWTIRDGYHRNLNASGVELPGSAEYANRSGWDTSYRGGAMVQATPEVRVRAAAYSGLRLPTLNELYRPFVVFPITTNANAELKNERLEGYEAGLDWQPAEGALFSITAFDNKVKNAVANVTVSDTVRERQNIDAIRSKGIELAAMLNVGQFGFNGALAYTDAEQQGSGDSVALDGFRPAQTPKWAANATVSYRPADRTVFSATVRHVGAQYEDDRETGLQPAATTLDLFAQVPVTQSISFVARAENVFDEVIVTRNQGGSMDYGVPATVWAGFRVGF